jgi:hypothetical protein
MNNKIKNIVVRDKMAISLVLAKAEKELRSAANAAALIIIEALSPATKPKHNTKNGNTQGEKPVQDCPSEAKGFSHV